MSSLSLFSKFKVAWNVMSSSPLYAIAFFLLAFLVCLFSTTNKQNEKQSKRTYLLIYVAVGIYFFVQYGNSFLTFVDYAINQVFITYYFPNIVIYLLMLLLTNIILWKSLFSNRITRLIRIFNSCFYGVITYFFILILSLVSKLNLNVFQLEELYSSNQVRSLLELSMFLFVLWIMILAIYFLIRKHQQKQLEIKKRENTDKDYEIISNFSLLSPYKIVRETSKPIKKEEQKVPTVSKEADPFTLEEYKVMLKILMEEKQKETDSFAVLSELYESVED